jgi:TetR/AcrR family transcriptional regulator, transcriptional repressor of aconitase
MPRVTEAHRQARRDEIADAALRVLARNGVSATSIAQIVEESGLSAGAIYANFTNKADLARYIASSLFEWRLGRIAAAAAEQAHDPVAVMRVLLSSTGVDRPPEDLLLQFWAEATRDPDLKEVLLEKVTALRAAFAQAVLPWARTRDEAAPEALADRTATTMVVLCQGYLTNRALLGWVEPDQYLDTARTLFA